MATPMLHDRYGLPLSTTSTEATEAYVDAIDRLLSINPGATDGFARAVAADEGFALGHAGLALTCTIQRKPAQAQAAIERARALTGGLARRERQHIAAIAAMVAGNPPEARRLMREHLVEFPRDALLLFALIALVRRSGSLTWPEEALALLGGLAADYGDDWWFLGANSFAHHELRLFEPSRRLGERSLELYPRNALPTHSLAHVYYETNDHATGLGFLNGWITNYQQEAELHGHLSWHLALFNLAIGQNERAIAIYERSIRPEVADGPNRLPDAASLLWRWLIYGLQVPGGQWAMPWGPVRDLANALTANPGMAFYDVHAALAYAGSGDADAMGRLIDGLRLLASNGNTVAGEVVVPLALGIDAFAQGDYGRTIALVEPIADRIVQIGGSHAQREVFEDTLLQAYLRAGRFERGATLLHQRLEHRHSARDAVWLGQADAGIAKTG